jgi:hypothetical protein
MTKPLPISRNAKRVEKLGRQRLEAERQRKGKGKAKRNVPLVEKRASKSTGGWV